MYTMPPRLTNITYKHDHIDTGLCSVAPGTMIDQSRILHMYVPRNQQILQGTLLAPQVSRYGPAGKKVTQRTTTPWAANS